MPPLKIIVDTREQTPWHFPEEVATVARGTLNAGDYALDGDKRLAIERKSLNDFLGTISTGWERFIRELDRMAEAKHIARVIIVEGGLRDVFEADYAGLAPKFVLKRIGELTLMQVSVLMADTAAHAAALAYSIFKRRSEQLYGNPSRNDPASEAWASLGIPQDGFVVDNSQSSPRRLDAKRHRQRRALGRAPSRRTPGTRRGVESQPI